MLENRLTIPRTARYFTLGPADQPVRAVWFVLHGYGQLAARFLRHFEVLDDGSRLIVAPEALSRFYLSAGQGRVGASWMTREDRQAEIDDYIGYLDALGEQVLAPLRPSRPPVHMLGFSQGVATACRWAALGRTPVDRLICWAGEVPPDLDLEQHGPALADLTLVVGTEDEYVSDTRLARETMRLKQQAVPYQLHRFEGGHRMDAAVLERLGGE